MVPIDEPLPNSRLLDAVTPVHPLEAFKGGLAQELDGLLEVGSRLHRIIADERDDFGNSTVRHIAIAEFDRAPRVSSPHLYVVRRKYSQDITRA